MVFALTTKSYTADGLRYNSFVYQGGDYGYFLDDIFYLEGLVTFWGSSKKEVRNMLETTGILKVIENCIVCSLEGAYDTFFELELVEVAPKIEY